MKRESCVFWLKGDVGPGPCTLDFPFPPAATLSLPTSLSYQHPCASVSLTWCHIPVFKPVFLVYGVMEPTLS